MIAEALSALRGLTRVVRLATTRVVWSIGHLQLPRCGALLRFRAGVDGGLLTLAGLAVRGRIREEDLRGRESR